MEESGRRKKTEREKDGVGMETKEKRGEEVRRKEKEEKSRAGK